MTEPIGVRAVRAVAAGFLKPWVLLICPEGKGGRRFEAMADVPTLWGCSCGEAHVYAKDDVEILFDVVKQKNENTEALRAAFEAGFQWAMRGHDKYGDYLGGPSAMHRHRKGFELFLDESRDAEAKDQPKF